MMKSTSLRRPSILTRLLSAETIRKNEKARYFADTTTLPNKRDNSEEYWTYRSKELRGDSLLKFLTTQLLIEYFPAYKTTSHVPVIDTIICNGYLIQVAQKLNLQPLPEDLAYFTARLKKGKAYANALEVRIFEIFETEGMESTKSFIDTYFFSEKQRIRYGQLISKNLCKSK